MAGPLAFWAETPGEVLAAVSSSAGGLTSDECERRLAAHPSHEGHVLPRWARVLLGQFASPIILILITATIVSMALGDVLDGSIILAIVALSGLLGFFQEFRAGNAVAALLARVEVTARVLRDGAETDVPLARLVPGDVVLLSAGSIVPADCRLLDAHDLLVDQSALTGESFPAEKDADASVHADAPLAERDTCVFFGSHVVSGEARAVVVTAAGDTQYGAITKDLAHAKGTTAFEKGITRFGLMLVYLMVVLALFIFAVDAIAGRGVIESLLFAVALAVGLTPQLLPAIVSLSLSAGARRLAASKVIVKRLDAIEDLGSLTVLCTDKTGTLTDGAAKLDRVLDPAGADSDRVLRLASLNAGLQTGFANPLDQVVLAREPLPAGAERLGEVPYDFQRKRLSVATSVDGTVTLITKGALSGVLDVCTTARTASGTVPLAAVRQAVDGLFASLSDQGFRVLGVATKPVDAASVDRAAETAMTFEGVLCFFDPPKAGAADALADLAGLGVGVRLITGDNARAARAVAASVGLDATRVLTGAEIDALGDVSLASAVHDTGVFAEVEPAHKRRIVQALRASGEVVAFLGDGINDAPALHVADVGISVDTAVDVAKQEASVVLLDKGLGVVADGVRLGRQTFANTVKYVRMTTSANFGNMLSMAIASLFLPFLPLGPRQILVLNFLTDIPATFIAADAVDPEQVRRPVRWDIASIRRFMLVFGALSTCFDLLTFAFLVWGLGAGETLFQTAWFVVSALTELAVLFSLRTWRPIWRSAIGRGLGLASLVVAVLVAVLPYTPWLGEALGLAPVAPLTLLALFAIVVLYVAANELVKRPYYRSLQARPA